MGVLLLLAKENYISYSKPIAKELGVDEAITFGELCSINNMFNGIEWFYFEQPKIINDTCLSKHRVIKALKNLREFGLISYEKRGIPAKNYYKLHEEKLLELMKNYKNDSQVNKADISSSLKIEPLEVENLNHYKSKSDTTINNKNTNKNTISKNTNNNNETITDLPPMENPPMDNPPMENPPINKITKELNTKKLNTKNNNNTINENFEKVWKMLKATPNDRKAQVKPKRKKELFEMGIERVEKAIHLYLKTQDPRYYYKRDRFFNEIIDNYLDKEESDFKNDDSLTSYDLDKYEKENRYLDPYSTNY